jgi:hypothetical protein
MREATLAEQIEMLAMKSDEEIMALNLVGLAASFDISVEDLRAQITAARKAMPEESELDNIEDPFPAFPKLFGPLHTLAEIIGPSLAYEHKILHLLTTVGLHLSDKVKLASDPWLQPRFFGAMLGPPGSTKSAVEKEMRGVLFPKGKETGSGLTYTHAPLATDILIQFSVNSGPALVQLFEDNRKILIAPDEITSLFEKGRSTTASPNSLFGELLRLFEGNETGRAVVRSGKRDKSTGRRANAGDQIQIDNAHLALIGGATEKGFQAMWLGTGGAASGLQSRFVLSYSDLMLPPFQILTDVGKAVEALRELILALADAADRLTISDDAQKKVVDWVEAHGSNLPPRALDVAKRAAIVLASCDCSSTVTLGVMKWCLAFADYQILLKARFMPEDADGNIQAFENRVISFLNRHKEASGRQIRRSLNPERYPGGYFAFEKAMYSLVRAGRLLPVGKTRKGKGVYRLD